VIKCATEPEMTAFNRRSVRAAERGYANRVCLSHDAGVIDGLSEADKAAQIPDWRFTFIPQEFSLMLRERGVSDEAIEQMTVGNPRAIFEQTEPY
jgi:predicted metal-dependent phosphotriesterase family hydrolase